MTDRTTAVPARRSRSARPTTAWRRCRAAAGCPERVPPVRVALERGARPGHRRADLGARSSPPFDAAAMDGIAVRAADTVGAGESTPLLPRAEDAFGVVDTGDPLPERLRRRRDARGRPLRRRGRPSCARPSRPTSTSARSARTSAPPSCCCRPATGCAPVDVAAAAAAGATEVVVRRAADRGDPADRRRDAADRERARARRAARHQLADARRPGARAGLRGPDVADRARRPGPHRRGHPRGGRRGATC